MRILLLPESASPFSVHYGGISDCILDSRLGNATLSLRELNRTEKRQSHNLELLQGDSSSTTPTVDEDEDGDAVVEGDNADAEAGPLSSGSLDGSASPAGGGVQATSVAGQGLQMEGLVDLEDKVEDDGDVEIGGVGTAADGAGGDIVNGAAGEEQEALALKEIQENSSEAGLIYKGSECEYMPWFIDVENVRFGLAEPVEGWTVLDQGSVPPLRGRTAIADETASAAAVSQGAAAGFGGSPALERVVALGGEEAKWKEAVGGMTDGQVGEWMLSVGISKQQVQRAKRAGELQHVEEHACFNTLDHSLVSICERLDFFWPRFARDKTAILAHIPLQHDTTAWQASTGGCFSRCGGSPTGTPRSATTSSDRSSGRPKMAPASHRRSPLFKRCARPLPPLNQHPSIAACIHQ